MEKQQSLKRELEGVKQFFETHEITFFEKPTKKENVVNIVFSLNIESFVSEHEVQDKFDFDFEIKEHAESRSYRLTTSQNGNIPFHPHFKITKNISGSLRSGIKVVKKAEWVGDDEKNKNAVTFIKIMIHALEFQKEFMNIKSGTIGNKKAKDWYLEGFQDGSCDFPTDNFFDKKQPRKIQSTSETKKFDIKEKMVRFKPKKFTVTSQTSYKLEEKKITDYEFKIDHELNALCNKYQSNIELYISKEAKRQIWEHIGWGNLNTSFNKIEQGGILLGHVYDDPERKVQFGYVTQIVKGDGARGSAVYLEMSHEIWTQMLNKADEIIDSQPEENLQVIGWYHTHPNELTVFMSGTDMNTQHQFFNQNWHYAIVLNPHRKVWKAFAGKEAVECKGFIELDKKDELFDKAADKKDERSSKKKS